VVKTLVVKGAKFIPRDHRAKVHPWGDSSLVVMGTIGPKFTPRGVLILKKVFSIP
jgi:hypothetical protein